MLTFFLSFPILLRMLGPAAYTYRNALCWGLCAEHARASDETAGPRKWAHLTLYALEFFPILGQLVSLVEVAASRCFISQPKPPLPPGPISTQFLLHAEQEGSCLMTELNDLFYITYAPQNDAQKRLFYLEVQKMQPQAIVSFISFQAPAAFLQPGDELTDPPCSIDRVNDHQRTVTFASLGGTSWTVPHYLISDSNTPGDVMAKVKDKASTEAIILTYANDNCVAESLKFAALHVGYMDYQSRMKTYQSKLQGNDT